MSDLDPVELIAQQEERRRAVAQIFQTELTAHVDDPNLLLAHTARMGRTESYLCTATLKWVAERVQFAHELPVFNQQLSEDGKRIVPDAENVKKLRQRPIDYSRQHPMAHYLIGRSNHKFAPLLLVLHDEWIDDPQSDNWAAGKAVKSAAQFSALDRDGVFGRLQLDHQRQRLYALDGQHRLLAIKGAIDIVNGLPLQERDAKGAVKDSLLTRDDYAARDPDVYTPQYFQRLAEERVGIEIISAVNQGETYTEASRRVRTLFHHVNKMAQPVPKGASAALNDDHGFTVVAHECLSHAALNGLSGDNDGQSELLVGMDRPNLTAKSNDVTTLDNLASCVGEFLGCSADYEGWIPQNRNYVPERPSDGAINAGARDFELFLTALGKTDVFRQVAAGVSASTLREFSVEGGLHSILLRPAMQQMVAAALGHAYFSAGMEWGLIEERFLKLDADGRFDSADSSDSYWFGLQVKPDTRRIKNSPQRITARLLAYLIGGTVCEPDMQELRDACQKARTMPSGDGAQGVVIGWDGAPLEGAFQLPAIAF